jgi:hypothetical protein
MAFHLLDGRAVRIPLLAAILSSICVLPGFGEDPPDFKVWVVNDSVRINPPGNRAYEDNPYLLPDALTGDYQASSQIWDAARRVSR